MAGYKHKLLERMAIAEQNMGKLKNSIERIEDKLDRILNVAANSPDVHHMEERFADVKQLLHGSDSN